MKDPSRTKQELTEEVSVLKHRIQELEKVDAEAITHPEDLHLHVEKTAQRKRA